MLLLLKLSNLACKIFFKTRLNAPIFRLVIHLPYLDYMCLLQSSTLPSVNLASFRERDFSYH